MFIYIQKFHINQDAFIVCINIYKTEQKDRAQKDANKAREVLKHVHRTTFSSSLEKAQ